MIANFAFLQLLKKINSAETTNRSLLRMECFICKQFERGNIFFNKFFPRININVALTVSQE